jgi:hypothetical protein
MDIAGVSRHRSEVEIFGDRGEFDTAVRELATHVAHPDLGGFS